MCTPIILSFIHSQMRPAELHEFVRLRADFRDEFITHYLS
jgi:hypothetical protein